MKLNILGTEYDISCASEKEYSGLRNRMGCCDQTSKVIKIVNNYDEKQYYAHDNILELIKTTKRHEIIHAFLFESGLTDTSHNEEIVEWIAVQFPKLLKAFNKTEAL